LKPRCDELLSKVGFNFNLRRCIPARPGPGFERYDGQTYTDRWAARITGQLLIDQTRQGGAG
jgi:hypothetical protein